MFHAYYIELIACAGMFAMEALLRFDYCFFAITVLPLTIPTF